MKTISIFLNGEKIEVPSDYWLVQILTEFNFDYHHFAVAVNKVFIPRQEHATYQLKECDEIEIVSPMAGG